MRKFKLKSVKYFGQMMADFLIQRLETSLDNEEFDFWFDIAVKLNAYCIVYYDIYLD